MNVDPAELLSGGERLPVSVVRVVPARRRTPDWLERVGYGVSLLVDEPADWIEAAIARHREPRARLQYEP